MTIPFEEIGNGKPVVLLHAFPLSGNMWGSQAAILAQNGYRVILPDFPGFGQNIQKRPRVSIEDMALQISELLEELNIEKAIVGGLSMGGYVLFNLLRIAPEKISALFFCDTTSAADTSDRKKSRHELIAKIENQGSAALVENMLPNLISEDTRQNRQTLAEQLKKTFLDVDPDSAIDALRSMAERKDHSALVGQILVPVLLIFGEFDKVTNLENARNLEQSIPDSELIIIKNAGHLSNLEQPEQFNKALLDFCNRIEY